MCKGAKNCVNKANEVGLIQADYAKRASELLEKARVNVGLSPEEQNELSILQVTTIQLEADRNIAIHNALMSGDSPEAKQLAINSLALVAGTSAAGIAAGIWKSRAKEPSTDMGAGNDSKQLSPQGYNVDPSKFDYFFGKVTTGNPHNVQRSAQNMKDLNTLGINNEQALIKVCNQAASNGVTISSKTNNYGTTVTKSIAISDKGAIQVSFFYPEGNMNSTPKSLP